MKSNAFLYLFVIVSESLLFSQNRYNFSQFGEETVDFIKQPIRWEGNDWLKLGLIGAGTFVVMQADQPIRDALMKDQSYNKSGPVVFGKLWGETYTTALIAGAFGLHGFLADNKSTRKVGFVVATRVVDLHDQKELPVQVSSIYPLTIRINLD